MDELFVLDDRVTTFTPLNLKEPTKRVKTSESSGMASPTLPGMSSEKPSSSFDPQNMIKEAFALPRPAPIRIISSSKVNNLSVFSLKTLFRVLSIDSVVQLFVNILLEKGIYFVSQSNRVGFDVIESLLSLIYPFKWELPKILSFECNYSLFDSPVPLLYFVNSKDFRKERLAGKDLTNKTLVFLDLNELKEFNEISSLDIASSKLTSSLKKHLEKTIGLYNKDYIEKKASMKSEDFQLLLENQEDTVPFDFWKVRGIFFDTMHDLLSDYGNYYKESKVLTSQLNSIDVFDREKFIKSKSLLKHKNFGELFTATNLFSGFIEFRISPESESQKKYFNTFDSFLKIKSEASRMEALGDEFEAILNRPSLQTIDPNPDSLTIPETKPCYKGSMPRLASELFCEPRVFPKPFDSMTFETKYSFNNLNASPKKFDEEKWARQNLELLYTIWFVSIRIFLAKYPQQAAINLVVFAFNKLSQLEAEKISVNIDMIKNLAFMLGVFKEVSKLQKLMKKYAKVINENNQAMAVYAEFVSGSSVKPVTLDPSLKSIKYGDIGSKKNEYSESELVNIDLQTQNDEKRDALIPVNVKSYFESNAFCQSCGTYIPEEIIFGKLDRGFEKTTATCPNQACRFSYEPIFKIIFLKEKGSTTVSEGIKLISPTRLWILIKDFLETHPSEDLFKQEISGDIYWNMVFYTNLLNVPAFFSEDLERPKILEYTLSNLHLYRCFGASKKENQNDSTGTGFADVSTMSPEKHNTSSQGGNHSGFGATSSSAGFSIHLNSSMQPPISASKSGQSGRSASNSNSLSPSHSTSSLQAVPKFEVKKDL